MNDIGDSETLSGRLAGMLSGGWVAQALSVAAQFNIPDLLKDGPRSSEDLARAIGGGMHAPSLHRLLRALVTVEIVGERDDGLFELLPLGSLLRSDSDRSLHSWAVFTGTYHWQTWGHLSESVRAGQGARKLLQGIEGFEYLEQDPKRAAIFNRSMVELTRLVSLGVVRSYDFSGLRRIVDVGGGYGELLAGILTANPEARGILFDMPHAIEAGKRHMMSAGLTGGGDRCEFVVGSFFESVPEGADAYVLKSVIHDWNDERATAILATCRRAMRAGAKLLLVERVMPERLESTRADQTTAFSDLNMLVSLGAQERTESEFRALLAAAGLRLTRVIPTGQGFSIVEAVP